ncbi:phospho-acceptor domain-containing protein [Tumebacillus permanentifrigoris]|uniref:histidine kinase n=2 Tax=Tumebacillus permanentifrigoris TaxID=378543 RepID=A0A316DXZ1_9BACL|nr:phospho-acceptor domain-containing protein [Tumebacillus permanentifrigoris]
MKRSRRDLFTRIRLRLTLTYSGMLIFILLLFTLIVFGVLFMVIFKEQNSLVQAQADAEVTRYQDLLQHVPFGGGQPPDVAEQADPEGMRFFTYIVNADGRLVYGEERMPDVRSPLSLQLADWVPEQGENQLATLHLPRRHGELWLLLAGRAIYQNGQLAGVLYTGNDVSYYWEVLTSLAEVMLILVALFGILSTVVGQRMAARAMVPIKSSYLKQQQFVADASHELRTPLAVLKSSIDVLDLEEGDRLSDVSQLVLADMKDEVQSMSKLVADLLTLARSDSGGVDLYLQPFDLVSTAEQIVRLRQSLAQEKGIELALDAPSPLSLTGDQERIKQLLAILLDNALAYTPSGGRVRVAVTAEHTSNGMVRTAVVCVEDTGIGIPLEDQERIFERFYRVEAARTRAVGGTGIGLAIARWIVEAHKGMIEVQSDPGTGSTFTVRLPVRK